MEKPNASTGWVARILRFLKYFFILYIGGMIALFIFNWIIGERDLFQIGVRVFWAGFILVVILFIAFTEGFIIRPMASKSQLLVDDQYFKMKLQDEKPFNKMWPLVLAGLAIIGTGYLLMAISIPK
jgi:hypothetical protein